MNDIAKKTVEELVVGSAAMEPCCIKGVSRIRLANLDRGELVHFFCEICKLNWVARTTTPTWEEYYGPLVWSLGP